MSLGGLRLRELSPERYARDVLPLTAPLWAGRRSFEEYVTQTLEVAHGSYGRRYYRTIGLYDGRRLVASFKRYERGVFSDRERLRALGFGAVFTPPEQRGRGYASLMLAMALDAARKEGFDVAYLFSDIHPQFYAAVGFQALPSHEFALRADALTPSRLELAAFDYSAWSGVRRIFQQCTRRNAAGFTRDAAAWNWIAMRARHGSEHPRGGAANFILRQRERVVAYVLGVRVPERDAFVLDEFGFAGDAAPAISGLLRAAAGDLRRVVGWLPPGPLRAVLPAPRIGKRNRPVLMMAPLRPSGAGLVSALALPKAGDFCWPTDHI